MYMSRDTVYWTMKNGQKISVDDMDIDHLRNTLKMIIRSVKVKKVRKDPVFTVNGEMASIDADRYAIGQATGNWCECDETYECQSCSYE